MGGEKIQQPTHGQLHTQGLVNGFGPFGGDALDLRQPLGVLFDDGEDIRPKGIHQPPGGDAAHALDSAGGQIFQNGFFPHGHPPLHDLGLELGAVGAVVGPLTVDGEALAGVDARHGAHDGDLLVLLVGFQAEDGIAVFLVAVDDRGDGAFQ